ncbi:MAG: hypothetical protein JW781_03090 [Deltaproteobacteria bacterium]|nr:hypothetical protein [Candidatus Anaeroferrophillacea bacterium]
MQSYVRISLPIIVCIILAAPYAARPETPATEPLFRLLYVGLIGGYMKPCG